MYKRKRKTDYLLIIFILLFMIISISTIYSANTYLPSYLGNLALKQLSYYLIGFILIFIILRIKKSYIDHSINFLYILGVLSLALLLVIGKSINGSKCWFIIPIIGSIQPSEIMKIILIMKLSLDVDKFFRKEKSVKEEFCFIIKELVIILIPSFLTFLEPDTGAVIMYMISSFVIFVISPFRKRWLFIIIGIILVISGVLIYLYVFNNKLFIDIFGTDLFYRIERISSWREGEGMQLENSLTAIGSSNLYGHGFNKTPIYFPESGTDFIFSVFASNFGLIGSSILIVIITLFDIYLVLISRRTSNISNKLFIAGVSAILIYQQVQNISMTLGLMPITGITLPFISYGGSSLISYLIAIGVILKIERE